MVYREPLLVMLVKLVDQIPFPEPPKKRGRGRPKVYSDRLIVKALVIMIIRRLKALPDTLWLEIIFGLYDFNTLDPSGG